MPRFAPRPVIRSLIMACMILLAGIPSQGQIADTLPLQQDLKRCNTGIPRLAALEGLSWAWLFSPRALPYIQQAEALVDSLRLDPDSAVRAACMELHAKVLYTKGYHHKFRRELAQAVEAFRSALQLEQLRKDAFRSANCEDGLGICMLALDLPHFAKPYFERELQLIRSMPQPLLQNEARALLHLAEACARSGEGPRARELLSQVDTTEADNHAFKLMLQAQWSMNGGDTSTALRIMARAQDVVQRSGNAWAEITVTEPLSRTYGLIGDHARSITSAERCMQVARQVADEGALCGCEVLRADALLGLGDEVRAEQGYRSAYERARHAGYIGLSREVGDEGSVVHALLRMKDLYVKQGRLREGIHAAEALMKAKDAVHAIEAREDVLRQDLQLAQLADSVAERQRLDAATVRMRTELTEAHAKRRSALILGITFAVLAAIVVLLLLRARKRDRAMAAHERHLAEQERTIAEFRIREQVGQDMHDDLGAGLSALKLRSELASEAEPDARRREELGTLSAMAGELIGSMRQIIWAMDTDHGSLADLVAYISKNAHAWCEGSGLSITVAADGPWPVVQLSPEQRRNTFLVVKEALHNVVKHAAARTVRLELVLEGEILVVCVADDGIGPPDFSKHSSGNGLRNMHRRIAALGGGITIGPGVAGGTVIAFSIPVIGHPSGVVDH